MIVALLLAAGLGRRFGGGKLTAEVGGLPVVRLAAVALQRTSVDRVLVVTGHDAPAVRLALDGLSIPIVHAAGFEEGMSASIRAGVEALPGGVTHVLVALGDQPGAAARHVVEPVLALARRDESPIVMARYRDGTGPPVTFAAALLPELLVLSGDAGARAVVDAEPRRVAFADLDVDAPADLDTPADLARVQRELEGLDRA